MNLKELLYVPFPEVMIMFSIVPIKKIYEGSSHRYEAIIATRLTTEEKTELEKRKFSKENQ